MATQLVMSSDPFYFPAHEVQRPTHDRIHIRSAEDAHTLFEAVRLGILRPVIRRLNDTERSHFIRSGSVFVWEESEEAIGLRRWTDGLFWSPSRMREPFLFYESRSRHRSSTGGSGTNRTSFDGQISPTDGSPRSSVELSIPGLVKQTYSAFVIGDGNPQRKWHMTAYFTNADYPSLPTVQDDPCLSKIAVPRGMYRSGKSRQSARALQADYDAGLPSPDHPMPPPPPPGTYLTNGYDSPSPSGSPTMEYPPGLQHSSPPSPYSPPPSSHRSQHSYPLSPQSGPSRSVTYSSSVYSLSPSSQASLQLAFPADTGYPTSATQHPAAGVLPPLPSNHQEQRYRASSQRSVPYPVVSLVTRQPQTLHGFAPLSFRTRTFETFTLTFARDADAVDVFESIKELTVISKDRDSPGNSGDLIDQSYAFDYQPKPPLDSTDGWNLFNPREEFARMGIGSRSKAWRFTDINKDYSFCPTYPARLVVPSRISDATLTYAAKYRSKARIPALVYLHWANYGSITRSSQPMVGLTNNRSIQDEKLIEAIFQSHLNPDSIYALSIESSRSRPPAIYGATATNLIIDARPTTNAMVMSVKGAGTENMEYYKDGKKAYLGVDNIHVMRESLSKVADALRDADQLASLHGKDGAMDGGSFVDRQALRKSGWLKHISAILEGTLMIVKNIHINSSHVLIHCSDGWDRTAQLSSLSQLCLDPYYRTLRGFQVLVEKDWLSFGHRFADRCGHLSSEKFFTTATGESQAGGGNAEAAQAFLASMQNKFTPQSHLKETSPVFHQFLECVRQIQRQHPARFEFNQAFLERLHYHLYSCQFGTFLWNNERERRTPEYGGRMPTERTYSVWDWFNSSSERPKWLNPDYNPDLDERNSRSPGFDMGVLLPNPKDVRFWNELYGRTDEEMNGRLVTSQAVGVEVIGPVESAEGDPVLEGIPSGIPLPPSPSPSPAPSEGVRQGPLPYQPRGASVRSQTLSVAPTPLGGTSVPPTPLPDSPSVSRADTFRSLETSGSAFSLKPATSPSTQPVPPPSPNPRRWLGESLAPGGPSPAGIKSIWSQFSSNASAALTAVQGAYEGARKDFRIPTFPGGYSTQDISAAGGELQEKPASTSSRRWDESVDAPSPWATYSRPVPSLLADNPWATSNGSAASTLQGSSNERAGKQKDVEGSATQSHVSESVALSDPFISRSAILPTSTRSMSLEMRLASSLNVTSAAEPLFTTSTNALPSATPSASRIGRPPSSQSSSSLPQPPASSGAPSDPLGVGFL
ncbi:hypothetical protein FRB99_002037 [Tulasnella sp. 403]|nr:hypothetical protein FRB99_002037 [Tulasnella sp. 403]